MPFYKAKSEPEHHGKGRFKTISQHAFHNIWTTAALPYREIWCYSFKIIIFVLGIQV